MKTILVFSTAYEPMVGGAEIAVREIAKRLESSFHFSLITYRFSRKLPRREQLGAVTVCRLGYGTFVDRLFLFPLLAFWEGRRQVRAGQADLLWAVMVSYASIGAYFLKLLWPHLPFLLTLQEGDSPEHLERGKMGLLGFWWRRLLSRADFIQVISTFLAEMAKKRGARCPIEIVANGVDVARFSHIPAEGKLQELRQRIGLSVADKVIITVSRLVRKNAVDVCIKSLKYLDSDYKLLIVGVGEEQRLLQGLVLESRLENRVIFAGNIAHKDLPDYFGLARVFVRPSRSEGLGNAFLEAMAAGVPVVGTAVGGIPDFLTDYQTGLFCRVDDPEDLAGKVRTLVENVKLYRDLQTQGRNLVRTDYDWSVVAQKMEQVFSRLLGQANF